MENKFIIILIISINSRSTWVLEKGSNGKTEQLMLNIAKLPHWFTILEKVSII